MGPPARPTFDDLAHALTVYYLSACEDGATLPEASLADRMSAAILAFQLGLQIATYAPLTTVAQILTVIQEWDAGQMGLPVPEIVARDRAETATFLAHLAEITTQARSRPMNAPVLPEDATACRSCQAPIVFRPTAKGKLAPYNVDLATGEVTAISHFATCPQAREWSQRS